MINHLLNAIPQGSVHLHGGTDYFIGSILVHYFVSIQHAANIAFQFRKYYGHFLVRIRIARILR